MYFITTSTAIRKSGPHFELLGRTHRNHNGDLPVLLVNADRMAKAKFKTDRFLVADLFDDDGSADIIHADPDNYANIPTLRYAPDPDTTTLLTGDAGARIVCGIVK
jgi:Cu-Zn family superoxide dismutase